ncbi:MAG: ABC transporter ATP-binding protein [Planctomycetota bacterium]|jgi:lipoprotein-releasing system ATP-binding protein|nr:ABC transporter ATP-binding protein [Planctomycetota bacterium]MDP6505202.1 ABC transporter ATP-binding protein [Planctomycetota bacterium]
MSESFLSVKSLSKSFETRAEPLHILNEVTFELSLGESLAVMGPSGSGKSTLLHILGTLEPPSRGEVRMEGNDPFELDDAGLAAFRNGTIGFVFQEHHLLPQCSTLENVLLPTIVADAKSDHEKRARELLENVGLSDRIEHRPAELSGGERQRVAIARALINEPKLLLCDEPTGNLDRVNAESVGKLFLDICEQHNTAMVVVTHSAALAATFPKRMELLDGELHPME